MFIEFFKENFSEIFSYIELVKFPVINEKFYALSIINNSFITDNNKHMLIWQKNVKKDSLIVG